MFKRACMNRCRQGEEAEGGKNLAYLEGKEQDILSGGDRGVHGNRRLVVNSASKSEKSDIRKRTGFRRTHEIKKGKSRGGKGG